MSEDILKEGDVILFTFPKDKIIECSVCMGRLHPYINDGVWLQEQLNLYDIDYDYFEQFSTSEYFLDEDEFTCSDYEELTNMVNEIHKTIAGIQNG